MESYHSGADPPSFQPEASVCVLGDVGVGVGRAVIRISTSEVRRSQGGMERLLDWLSRTRIFILALIPTRLSRSQVTSHLSVSSSVKKLTPWPWLQWLRGLSAGLKTKGLLVQFPVRSHAWVVGQVPNRGRARDNYTLMFLPLSFSLPSPCQK